MRGNGYLAAGYGVPPPLVASGLADHCEAVAFEDADNLIGVEARRAAFNQS
jgi:hypothetical protein